MPPKPISLVMLFDALYKGHTEDNQSIYERIAKQTGLPLETVIDNVLIHRYEDDNSLPEEKEKEEEEDD